MNRREWAMPAAAVMSMLALVAVPAAAQTITVSGRVVEEGRGTPVAGATVRLTGADPVTTDSLGRFRFGPSIPGRIILTAASIGYEYRSVELVAATDTSLTVEMKRRVVTLDTMVVRPGRIRVRVTAVDSASGNYLLQAEATLYPGGKHVATRRGGILSFDSVPPNTEVTIIIEAIEHLPTRVVLTASNDTAFRVPMGVDSVALRMIGMQVQRLDRRSMGSPSPVRSTNRDMIMREGAMSMGELLKRLTFGGILGCTYIDEARVAPGVVDGLLPELIERIEMYGSARKPSMIRVYTKRYVASLIGRETVPGVFFKGKGVTPRC